MSKESIRWGDIVLDDVQVSGAHERSFVVQTPARGNGGRLLDRGHEVREFRVTVKWTKRGADDEPEERHAALVAMNDGRTRMLTLSHGVSMPAKMSIDSDEHTRGHRDTVLRFIEDRGDPRYVREPATGTSVQTAIKAVQERAKAAETALGAAELPTDVATRTAAAAASWSASDEASVEATNAAGRHASAIQAAVEDSGAADNLDLIDVYLSMLDLRAALFDAADVLAASTPGSVDIDVGEPVTVLALAASLGADEAERRMADILRMNNLRSINAVVGPLPLKVPIA